MSKRESYTVETTGKGRPDYSQDVYKSVQHPGFKLDYNEQLINNMIVFSDIASPYAWCRGPIADGEEVHLISSATGLPMPYTLLKGYLWRCIQDFWSFTERMSWYLYLDGYMASEAHYDTLGTNYYSEVVPLDTRDFDPEALCSHTIDFRVKNESGVPVYGFWTHSCTIEAYGTPPYSDKKEVICKHCGNKATIGANETKYTCPKCGKLTMYKIDRHGGRTKET